MAVRASTGFAGASKHWRFELTHTNIVPESPKTTNYQYSRFVNLIAGGEVGGEVYNGTAFSEQIKVVHTVPL